MKQPKRKGLLFFVGQIVVDLDGRVPFRIVKKEWSSNEEVWFYWDERENGWYYEDELRALNAKEVGPGWKRKELGG